jgi:hypothetical protein
MRHRVLDHQRGARHGLAGQAVLAAQPDRRRLFNRRLGEAFQQSARVGRGRAGGVTDRLGGVAGAQAGPRPLEQAGRGEELEAEPAIAGSSASSSSRRCRAMYEACALWRMGEGERWVGPGLASHECLLPGALTPASSG